MLGLNQKMGTRVSVIHSSFKTCFDKHLKIKRPKIAQAILGFMLGMNQKMGTRVSVIPLLY
jgi:hypothetical protein